MSPETLILVAPAEPAAKLPPEAAAHALLVILIVVVVAVGALLAFTVARRMTKVRKLRERHHDVSRKVPPSPWAEAGRRAQPIDEKNESPERPGGSTPSGHGGSPEAPG